MLEAQLPSSTLTSRNNSVLLALKLPFCSNRIWIFLLPWSWGILYLPITYTKPYSIVVYKTKFSSTRINIGYKLQSYFFKKCQISQQIKSFWRILFIFLMRMWSGERDRGKRENHISNYFWERIYFFKSLNKIWKYMWIKHKLSNWSFLKNISSLAKLPFWAKIQESKNPIPKKRYPKN